MGTVKCDGLTGTHEGGDERGGQLVKSSGGECNVHSVGQWARVA